MHALLAALWFVVAGLLLAFALWSRRGGLDRLARRRHPDGERDGLWPTSRLGWVLFMFIGVLGVGTIVISVRNRAWNALSVFVVVVATGPLVSRWISGRQ